MQYGFSMPPFGDFSDPHLLIDAARRAEAAGWDGFFIWDHMFWDPSFHPNLDPWVGLAGVAMATTTIRIGTLITPLARRRPWKVARETVTLDRLSNGRFIFGVGLGDPVQWDFGFFHEETDAKTRAAMLDESLEIITNLWKGEPTSFSGRHYQHEEVTFKPTPLQTPRIPIWVAGNWKNQPPMRRAARWDGYVPLNMEGMTPDHCREAHAYINQHRASPTPCDLVTAIMLPDDVVQARERLHEYAEAGLTWYLAPIDPWSLGADWEAQWHPDYTQKMLAWIDRGPIRI
jgi:alkanesulfonate monooxygenase SsuD/methylene tetrahydromethanopterin reductase-like flavin-dependent oxidoreductase (luciferase family)